MIVSVWHIINLRIHRHNKKKASPPFSQLQCWQVPQHWNAAGWKGGTSTHQRLSEKFKDFQPDTGCSRCPQVAAYVLSSFGTTEKKNTRWTQTPAPQIWLKFSHPSSLIDSTRRLTFLWICLVQYVFCSLAQFLSAGLDTINVSLEALWSHGGALRLGKMTVALQGRFCSLLVLPPHCVD